MPATAPARLTPGQTVGPYRIAALCGPGAVAEAVDPNTHRRLAIKLLPFDLVGDAAAWQRYRAFVDIVRAWKHVQVVELHGVEAFDGRAYLLMEHVAGGSLADAVARSGRLPWRVAIQRVIEAGRTIVAGHAAGIIHGSIRPSNLLLTAEGRLKIGDFSGGFIRPSTGDYSAPELFAGRPADTACDVYSLGATLFALLSGHAPFGDAANETELANAHASRSVPNVRSGAADMPLRCELVVQRAMAKKPADRYPGVSALVDELESILRSEQPAAPVTANRLRPTPPRPRRSRSFDWRRWLTPAAILAFLAAATYMSFFRPGAIASKPQSKSAPVISRPSLLNGIGMKLVEMPGDAKFYLGDAIIPDAKPHVVKISKPLLIGQMEVNQREFAAVMGFNPSRFQNDNNPVEMVSWDEAVEFCKRLSAMPTEKEAGRVYRLPTEAEWELACRAGTTTPFAFTPGLTAENANFGGLLGRTFPVGSYEPNRWGLYDMHGNVGEWCSDWYGYEYYVTSPAFDPPGPEKGTKRVVRGGAFMTGPDGCRSAARDGSFKPDYRGPEVGFRVVCNLEVKDKPKN